MNKRSAVSPLRRAEPALPASLRPAFANALRQQRSQKMQEVRSAQDTRQLKWSQPRGSDGSIDTKDQASQETLLEEAEANLDRLQREIASVDEALARMLPG